MNKQRSRARRWWMAGAGVLALALIVLFVYGRQAYSESRSVLAFIDALEAEDASRLSKSLVTDRGGQAVDEAGARKLLDYFAERNLTEQAIADVQRGYEGYMPDTRLLAVVKVGKHFGLFDRYRIAVTTSTVEASTNFKDTVISLDGEAVATADSDDYRAELGPLMPGIYKLEASFDGEFAHLRAEQTIEVSGQGGTIPVDLALNGGTVQVEANYENAAIFVDGRNTGKVTGADARIGPVALDGSSRMHAELAFPWGMAKSAAMPVQGERVRLQIDPNTDELKEAVMAAVASFIQSWSDAYNKQDASVVRHLSEERKAQLASGIEEYKSLGMVNETLDEKLVFDAGGISVQRSDDGTYRTAVSLRRTFVSRYYAVGEEPPPFDTFTDTMTYRLALIGDDWTVTDWYEEPHFDPVRTAEWEY